MSILKPMNAWIFDVDGVLVHLEERRIVEKQLLVSIISLLQKDDVVTFISGRSTSWQRNNVITLLEKEAQRLELPFSLFDNVFLSGEFGGTSIYFQEGKEIDQINKAHIIPKDVLSKLKKETQPFLDKFILEPKETIFTVFTRSLKTFSKDKIILVDKFQRVLNAQNAQDKLEVHVDSTAINVKYKEATKAYATGQVLFWLQKKQITPNEFIVLGDSLTDLEMGEELQRQQMPFTFVYVGDQETLETHQPSFPLTFTKEKYDKGTLEYLSDFISD